MRCVCVVCHMVFECFVYGGTVLVGLICGFVMCFWLGVSAVGFYAVFLVVVSYCFLWVGRWGRGWLVSCVCWSLGGALVVFLWWVLCCRFCYWFWWWFLQLWLGGCFALCCGCGEGLLVGVLFVVRSMCLDVWCMCPTGWIGWVIYLFAVRLVFMLIVVALRCCYFLFGCALFLGWLWGLNFVGFDCLLMCAYVLVCFLADVWVVCLGFFDRALVSAFVCCCLAYCLLSVASCVLVFGAGCYGLAGCSAVAVE